MAVPTRSELNQLVANRLAEDAAFREELRADPRAAVSALLGTDVPEFITITVYEESLTDVHLVIPATAGDEIAEDDLEMVAGGFCWVDESSSGHHGPSYTP